MYFQCTVRIMNLLFYSKFDIFRYLSRQCFMHFGQIFDALLSEIFLKCNSMLFNNISMQLRYLSHGMIGFIEIALSYYRNALKKFQNLTHYCIECPLKKYREPSSQHRNWYRNASNFIEFFMNQILIPSYDCHRKCIEISMSIFIFDIISIRFRYCRLFDACLIRIEKFGRNSLFGPFFYNFLFVDILCMRIFFERYFMHTNINFTY